MTIKFQAVIVLHSVGEVIETDEETDIQNTPTGVKPYIMMVTLNRKAGPLTEEEQSYLQAIITKQLLAHASATYMAGIKAIAPPVIIPDPTQTPSGEKN